MRIRKLSVLAAFFVILSAASHARAFGEPAFRLVSDIDDTIKVTNVRSKIDAVRNGLLSKRAFAGMASLYRSLAKNARTAKSYYLSGSPREIQFRLDEFLRVGKFPEGALFLRDIANERSLPEYKLNRLRLIASEVRDPKGAQWILIGDDTQADAEVYEQFKAELPSQDRVSIYIRQVSAEPSRADHVHFQTAFDLALHLYDERGGRDLTESDLLAVGEGVLNSEADSFLPKFVNCQTTPARPGAPTEALRNLQTRIDTRWRERCARLAQE